MRIALVWNDTRPLQRLSFRFELYAEGLSRLGHEPLVVCRRGCDEGTPYPVVTADDLADVDFWRRLGATVALTITYHRFTNHLRAMAEAGLRVVAISDSDGRVGLRTHPWATLERMIVYRQGLRSKLGCLKYFLGRYLGDGWSGEEEDREYLASTRASDAVVFHSPQAIDAFRRFLRRHHADAELAPRLHVAPFAVSDAFCDTPVLETRDELLVAAGRWSDPQKDSPLLAAALDRLLSHRPSTRVHLYGRDAEPVFGPLAARHPGLRLLGFQPHGTLIDDIRRARAVVFASRWETGPHAATEALALGTPVVGPPIPNLLGLAGASAPGQRGPYGTVSANRRPASLADALTRELQAWDDGLRDPRTIAGSWRPRLRVEAVCRRLLGTLESNANPGTRARASSETTTYE